MELMSEDSAIRFGTRHFWRFPQATSFTYKITNHRFWEYSSRGSPSKESAAPKSNTPRTDSQLANVNFRPQAVKISSTFLKMVTVVLHLPVNQ